MGLKNISVNGSCFFLQVWLWSAYIPGVRWILRRFLGHPVDAGHRHRRLPASSAHWWQRRELQGLMSWSIHRACGQSPCKAQSWTKTRMFNSCLFTYVTCHCISIIFWIMFSADCGCHASALRCVCVAHCDFCKTFSLKIASDFMIKIQHVTVQKSPVGRVLTLQTPAEDTLQTAISCFSSKIGVNCLNSLEL